MLRRTVCAGMFAFALLGTPRLVHAGLVEFIWKMSGPQFIGAGYGCSFDFKLVRQDCRVTTVFAAEEERKRRDRPVREPYFFAGGELQFSTGRNDSDGSDYKAFQLWRAALTPSVSFYAFDAGKVPIYAGAGVSWDLLFGKDFRRFDKFAITVTPAEAVIRENHAVAFKLRIYPNAYTSDEFGFGPRQDYDRPTEVAWGFSYSYRFE